MTQTTQNFTLVRAARLTDAAALAALTRELLLHEQSRNNHSSLRPWAASAAELRKQLRQPNTRFFVAQRGDELVGYLKAVAYGLTINRVEAGWRAWLVEWLARRARAAFNFLLGRPRPHAELRCGFIAGAFVKPAARRSHVGQALVNAAENWLRAQGLTTSELQVLQANAEARQFWESLGYEPVVTGMRKSLTPDQND